MGTSRILVVYYSRTGNTRIVAQTIADRLRCVREELVDIPCRTGLRGYFRCVFDTAFKRRSTICATLNDASEFDLVIVGTPIWGHSVSAPVRTYLERIRGRVPRVAFFSTYGGLGHEHGFDEMTELAGRAPCATLAITEQELDDAMFLAKVRLFRDRIYVTLDASSAESGSPVNGNAQELRV